MNKEPRPSGSKVDSYEDVTDCEVTGALKEEASCSKNEESRSTCRGTFDGSLNHCKCDLNERLEEFVKAFVSHFEEKLTSFYEEVTPGKNTSKAGKTVQGAAKATEALTIVPLAGKAMASLSGESVKFVGNKIHRKRVKRIVEVFGYKKKEVFLFENTDLRRILVEAAGDIFESFEVQFAAITGINESSPRAIVKLAMDAMDRAMNYINDYKKENPSESIEISVHLITKGVILGRSKEGIGAKLLPKAIQKMPKMPKPGYTVKDKNSNKEWKTSELYEITGIIKKNKKVIEYYTRKGGNTKKYGYRLPLIWELQEWEKLKQYYRIDNMPLGEYKYILESEEVKGKTEKILAEINRKDPISNLQRIEETRKDNMRKHETIQRGIEKLEEKIVDNNKKINKIHEVVTAQKNEEIKGPVWFNIKYPVESFTGRRKELADLHCKIQKNLDKPTVITQVTSICGLGGIGKTELARKYAHDYKNYYDGNIVWVNAEEPSTLEKSFRELATELGISTKSENDKEATIEIILKKIYNFFADRESLFIFDNAEKYRTQERKDGSEDLGIDRFLPPFSPSSSIHKPRFLITSRNQKWGNIDVIQLNTFTEEDARDFIRNALNIDVESQEQDIKILAEKLQFYPLAMQQAVAYIKEKNDAWKNTSSKFDIRSYLNMYDEQTEKLLNFPFPDDSSNLYTKTTFTTWKITVDKIKENKKYGREAGEILDILAYLAPDNIPVQMFLGSTLIGNDKDKLGYAVQCLKNYSMVNSGQEETLLNVHRLVQQVTRINLKDQNEDNIIEVAFELLKGYYPYGSAELDDYNKKRQLLPHLEAFLLHIDGWAVKSENKHYIKESYLINLLAWMSEGYSDLGSPRRQKKLLERALKINEERYGDDHYKVAIVLHNLAVAYGGLGNCQKEKELLERALSIDEKHYGVDHYEVATTIVSLAFAYGDSGDCQKQKELLERALEIQEKHYGLDHYKVATTIVSLAAAYGGLGYCHKQKELLERALRIKEKHYGGDHYKVAITMVSLAVAYGESGDCQKQKELLEGALRIEEKHYGLDHYAIAIALVNLGVAYGNLGDCQKTKELLERALRIEEKHYGLDHYELATTMVNLGDAYRRLGDCQKQKELLERALKILEKPYDHYEVAKTMVNLGDAYGRLGDCQIQKELLERALRIQVKHYGLDHNEVGKTMVKLGVTYASLGDCQKAYEFYEKSSKIIKKQTPLHFAVQSRNLETVKYILERGADILAKNEHGTVLHQAVYYGNEEVIVFILEKIKERFNRDPQQIYESINAKDTEGDTPLMWASETGKTNVAKILLTYGANLNDKNNNGETVLHWAARGGYLHLVRLFLDKKADPDIKNTNGKVPLDLAQENLARDSDNNNLKTITALLYSVTKNYKSQ